MTIRNPTALLFTLITLGMAGGATPGPNHLYVVAAGHSPSIRDHAAAGIETRDAPSLLEDNDTLLGLAYDDHTDHFFLHLAPGNHFRVVGLPDRSTSANSTPPRFPPAAAASRSARATGSFF